MEKKENENSAKNYIKFSGIALQMGATIFLMAYLGKWLDERYPADKKWFTMFLTILGVSISLYNVIRQLNKHNDQQK